MSEYNKSKKDISGKKSYSTLSSKNQITVPSIIREKLNAEPGDQVVFYYNEESKEITVSSIKKDSLLSLYGSMPPKGDKGMKDWDAIRKMAKNEYFNKEKNI
ncbi:AbrB/MazE/SpoVT family DNA-binding domain-containing protein [Bacillus timonensis]|uniref:AbrB/MazE/SpoVT family DNA-binding domain-containing protein n=1 Tax=Bacillus timonensis TaxID=1033734 RepID=A0A4S3PTP7_9BACI|nr:AbrB/MazE/SpoVT family DNA-binding domain-containing protein [Bacillus timonensis]THE13131.1 AbrB/MazE/SpoVT family DNA-binding domain-containing protein [Bacillus timonensis]